MTLPPELSTQDTFGTANDFKALPVDIRNPETSSGGPQVGEIVTPR
jgi:hypothetical protein